jgi:YhcH/YjgK/YiaL family protein
MIVDKLENSDIYSALGERIKKAFDFLKNTDLNALPTGKTEIEGSDIFAAVSEYETKAQANCKLEAHRKYLDVQYLVKGSELIGYAPASNQEVIVDYNEEKDIIFFKADVSTVLIQEGMFAIFFPEDLHQPCIQANSPMNVKKVVVKVRL